MSKRQDAPGALELIRQFVNTLDIETGSDELSTPERLREWLSTRGLIGVDRGGGAPGELRPAGAYPDAPIRGGRAGRRRALELRESLRAILLAHTDRSDGPSEAYVALDAAAARARLSLRFDQDGSARLEPAADGIDGALGRLVAIVHTAISDGTWTRLKACREPSCEWAFYDHTKNRSGTWCTMQVCGNRSKARAYRGRRAIAHA